MFIESGTGRPDDEPDRPRRELPIPWSLIGWSALVLWLFAASLVTDGLVGAGLAWAAVLLGGWRGARLIGSRTGGLRDYKQ